MVLVTGSSGLVGSHLLYSLIVSGAKVKALIRDQRSKEKILNVFRYYTKEPDKLLSEIIWQYGDITEYSGLEKAFNNIEYVYHCAAVISFDHKSRSLMSEVNIQGTVNIVKLCIGYGVKKLVHVSSIAAIGHPKNNSKYIDEKLFPKGKLSGYSYSKTQSELKVWQGIAEGLNAVIINPSIILGPGNWNSGSGKLFTQVNKGMKFYTRGITGFVDVKDVVRCMIHLMKSNVHSERFIVSSGNYSFEKVFRMIANALRVKEPRFYATPFLTSIAWRAEAILSIFSSRDPLLTRNSSKASHNIQKYTSEKLISQTKFNFIPIEESIKQTARLFYKDHKM